MVYLLKAFATAPARELPPQRRRTIIIGGGPTGISAAFHLGEHSLLLERRGSLEETYDYSIDRPLGAARGSSVGSEDPDSDGQRPGTSVAGRKALFITCSTSGESAAGADRLIHVARWQPPAFSPLSPTRDEFESDPRENASLRALVPRLRGEVRLGTNVVRVSPSLHLLELADGSRYVYDKLLSTVPMLDMATLVMHELARRNSQAEFLRYWLRERDIEVADRATQIWQGDVDEVAAGKRVAELINRGLSGRFHPTRRGSGFFEPRLVGATATATP